MFCADYVAAFIFHGLLTAGAVYFFDKKAKPQSFGKHESCTDRTHNINNLSLFALGGLGIPPSRLASEKEYSSNNKDFKSGFVLPTFFGVSSGLLASITLYPFDFVRGGVLQPGLQRIFSAGSTVPYAATLFGVYFSCRDSESTSSQLKWGAFASGCAVAAEAPFDHAKRAMIGNTRVMIGAGFLYVPFATIMLVMYDKAVMKFVQPYLLLNPSYKVGVSD